MQNITTYKGIDISFYDDKFVAKVNGIEHSAVSLPRLRKVIDEAVLIEFKPVEAVIIESGRNGTNEAKLVTITALREVKGWRRGRTHIQAYQDDGSAFGTYVEAIEPKNLEKAKALVAERNEIEKQIDALNDKLEALSKKETKLECGKLTEYVLAQQAPNFEVPREK